MVMDGSVAKWQYFSYAPKNIYVYVPVYQTALDLIGMRYGTVWEFDEGYFLKYFLFENILK
jgi:hypothetical protein